MTNANASTPNQPFRRFSTSDVPIATFALVIFSSVAYLLFQNQYKDSLSLSQRSAPPSTQSIPIEGFRSAARYASPAVVSIISSKTVRLSPDDMDPFWFNFFGRRYQAPRKYRERGLGSGVIATPAGYIITNEHVVSGAGDIRVLLADKREFKAKLVGADAKTDLAVLKIEASDLPSLPLSDSSRIDTGDIVLAIGNPFGVGQSVTMGIVSATARHGVVDPERYEDFIQTDAAINPGNSGGALVTAKGEWIAINTAIITRSGGNQGIGFAIPTNVARHVMDHLIKDGRMIRGWLGISIQPIDATTAKAFGLKEPSGALVGEVTPNGPAEKAGVRPGDIILEFNNSRITDSADLRSRVAMSAPNASVTLKVLRDEKQLTLMATLGELKEQDSRLPGASPTPSTLEGVQLGELNRQTLRELGLPLTTSGVLVEDVEPGSPAAESGLRAGDVILEVNRRRIASVDQLRQAIAGRAGQAVVLFVNRSGNTLYIVIEPR